MDRLHVHLIAAEASGDALGAGLIKALRAERGDGLKVTGLGGPKMAAEGVESPFDIGELSIVGLVEGFMAYGRILKLVEQAVDQTLEAAPDVVIPIDSWGFTIRVAERLRRRAPDLTQIKYVGPQVWASRPKRARNLARAVDHVLTLQPFEPPYFEKYGLPATFVGHPVFDDLTPGDGAAFRARHGVGSDQKLGLVLFGSRRSEARRLAEPFAEAVSLMRERFGEDLVLVAPIADSIADQTRALLAQEPRFACVRSIDGEEKRDAFAAADAALACSGTVVTELAIAETPAAVAYRLDPISYRIAKMIVTAPHISLVNMVRGERLLPEFVQHEATGEALADAVGAFLTDEALAARTRAGLRAAVETMRGDGGSASARAAQAVLQIMGRDNAP